jgi:di/tricarboxylate transporter
MMDAEWSAMGWEAVYCLAIIIAVLVGLAAGKAPDALLVGAVVLVTLVGIITPEEAFAGFSNTGMLTVGALFVVAAGLRETGALDRIGGWMLGRATTERSVVRRLAVSVTGMSAFLNNTPIVSMFIPIIIDWCKKRGAAPSRLLLPLSYLCILGGTCTLIGTSTNLVVDGLLRQTVQQQPELMGTLYPMALFEMSAVGIPYAIVGALYLYFIGYRLLPDRKDPLDRLSESYREYLANMRIEEGCRLVGQQVQEAGLRQLPGLFLIEIVRGTELITPIAPDQILHAGDVLTFTGAVSTIVELEKIPGLVSIADGGYDGRGSRDRMLCEAVVSSTSPALGKTIRDAQFRATYNAAVVAVHRGGERLKGRVGDIVLHAGDTLLLQTGPHFVRAHRNNPDFLLISGIYDSRPFQHEKAIVSLGLLALLIVLMATQVVDIVIAAFLVAALMIATRCISVSEARQSIDWQTLITIGAAFGLAKALENSGGVAGIADYVVANAGTWGPLAILVAIYFLTSMVTELVTNNAAAALLFPFAVAIAGQMDVNPRTFVMAIAFAASASFITPLGYQTNLMVYGPGGYKVTDFIRVGLPLNLILLALASVLIPLVWPFYP